MFSPDCIQFPQPDCDIPPSYISGWRWQECRRPTVGLDFASFLESSGEICCVPLVRVFAGIGVDYLGLLQTLL